MLYQLLCERAKDDPDKMAIVSENRSLTYGQLLQEAQSCAAYLRKAGLRPQARIVAGLPPCPEAFVLFYAAWALGAMVVPVLPSGKVATPLREFKPAVIVGDRTFLQDVEDIWPNAKEAILWDPKKGLQIGSSPKPLRRRKIFRAEKLVVGSSSGTTTGTPTLGFHSAEEIVRRQTVRANMLELTPDDVFLVTRPLIAANVFLQVILPVIAGGKIVVLEKFERLKAAAMIAQERVTVLYTVPPVFELLASIPVSSPVDFSSLRLCVSGGAPLAPAIGEQFYRRFGIPIRQTYAGRQLTPAFTVNVAGPAEAVGHKSGPYPVAILDDDGNEVAAGEVGEIAFDIAKVEDSFLRAALEKRRSRRGNYLLSGDLGKLDDRGYLYVVGRKGPFIKVGGNRVEPAEVENVLRSHPKVSDVIVFAVHAGLPDESVGAVVVPSGPLTSRELVSFCAEKLDSYKCPRSIEFCDTLPRNSAGKVMRYLFEQPSNNQRIGE